MASDAERPTIDAKRLIAGLRARDPRVIEEAYAWTFGTELGRMVLAHHLAEMGFGEPIRAATDAELREKIGQLNAALDLAQKAGFGQPALVVAAFTDSLEGLRNEDPNDASAPFAVLNDDDDV